MTRVLCIHGVGQQFKGGESLCGEWTRALRDGMQRSGCADAQLPRNEEVRCVFYGDLFRPAAQSLDVGEPWLTAVSATEFDQELLLAWWREAADLDPQVIHPNARTLVRTPSVIQAGLRALSGSAFFAGLAKRAMLFDLQQVRRYITDAEIRAEAQERVAAEVTAETRVLVGHSLGSVLAYEALCAHPEWAVRALVTLGSPLGIRNLIFDRLVPPPTAGKSDQLLGVWPGSVAAWTNVADAGDVVALVKDLRPQFGAKVDCYLVHNGSHAHDVRSYLTAAQTGAAVAAALG